MAADPGDPQTNRDHKRLHESALFLIFLCIQVIEITEPFVEAMHRRQMLVAVAQVVLAELCGIMSDGFQNLRQSEILLNAPS